MYRWIIDMNVINLRIAKIIYNYFLGSFGESYTKLLRNFTNLLKVY